MGSVANFPTSKEETMPESITEPTYARTPNRRSCFLNSSSISPPVVPATMATSPTPSQLSSSGAWVRASGISMEMSTSIFIWARRPCCWDTPIPRCGSVNRSRPEGLPLRSSGGECDRMGGAGLHPDALRRQSPFCRVRRRGHHAGHAGC